MAFLIQWFCWCFKVKLLSVIFTENIIYRISVFFIKSMKKKSNVLEIKAQILGRQKISLLLTSSLTIIELSRCRCYRHDNKISSWRNNISSFMKWKCQAFINFNSFKIHSSNFKIENWFYISDSNNLLIYVIVSYYQSYFKIYQIDFY